MTVEDAHEFFLPVPLIARKLQTLLDVGLGYIKLGQTRPRCRRRSQRVKAVAGTVQARIPGVHWYILERADHRLHFHDNRSAAESDPSPARPGQTR